MNYVRTVRWAVILFLITFALSRQTVFLVKGPSMSPAIKDPSIAFVVPTLFSTPGRGDIVVLRDPWRRGTTAVKRIRAVGGECAPVQTLEKSGADAASCRRVPDGYFFVVGDNEPVSVDSRSEGFVRADATVGSVIWVVPI